jgi:hypothetical protein
VVTRSHVFLLEVLQRLRERAPEFAADVESTSTALRSAPCSPLCRTTTRDLVQAAPDATLYLVG